MRESVCDILIVGGGVGGVAAALAASRYGLKVILTEEYAWVGGQLTSQGVPPDEHRWIETCGCTGTYRQFRNAVRRYYRQKYLVPQGVKDEEFNPGGGFVSGLCHEPRIAHAVLMEMLSPALIDGSLELRIGVIAASADVDGDTIKSVHVINITTGVVEVISASIIIDCTETGELLPMTGTEYVSGAESRKQTQELHASDEADENDVQGITWCFAAGYDPSKDHTITRPSDYDFWRRYTPQCFDHPWPGALLNWTAVSPITLEPREFELFARPEQPYNSLWNYRKIVSPDIVGAGVDEVTLVNWPQNDYFIRNIIDQTADVVETALEDSRQLSLSLLYWMQTEAPTPEGGIGYPGLYLAPGVLGTEDGFAMAPYIRESRRICALRTVTEAHVGTEMRSIEGFDTAAELSDTVGIGSYRIDLHPTPSGRNYVDISSLPFQIPLGALIPIRMRNLIAGNKNIGVTHITNGCYRLHPVEWNIGESAGHLAGYCLVNKFDIRAIDENTDRLHDFQERLAACGIELAWPAEIARTPR